MAVFMYDPFTDVNLVPKEARQGAAPFMGPVDIVEDDNAFTFTVDCPGLGSKDCRVRVTDDTLQISGERHRDEEKKGQHFHRRERSFGKFCRTFRLPQGSDVNNVRANCEHGVLVVVVGKTGASHGMSTEMALAEQEGDGTLNPEFEAVKMNVFPTPAIGKIVIIDANSSILDAVKLLSEHHILSAPVRNPDEPDSAPWSDKYIGMVDMVGIVFHMLDVLKPEKGSPEDFAKEIEQVDSFRKTSVRDAISFARFGPFVPVDYDRGTLLDCMLICGHHGIRRVPVVKTPGGDIVNIITQSALVQTLSANLDRFQSVGKKTLQELGLGEGGRVWSVDIEQPLQTAFQLIRDKDISAVPVVDEHGAIRGNISARDVRLIISSTKIYKLLNMPIRVYLDVVAEGMENSAITCSPNEIMENVIKSLVESRIHRIYVVDDQSRPVRVISLRNILKKFVKEPSGYFGTYFEP